MSELISRSVRPEFRWVLMTTVSAVTLLGSAHIAAAADSERDTAPVWIELGGVLERVDGGNSPFTAPFMTLSPTPAPYSPISPLEAQRPPRYSVGGEGKVTFGPDGSPWSFSAAIRYGRSSNKKDIHQQTFVTSRVELLGNYLTRSAAQFAEYKTWSKENHFVLDFQAGMDVGLGLGRGSTSTISAGIRFAEFAAKSSAVIKARPDVDFYPVEVIPGLSVPFWRYEGFRATAFNENSFHGVGPSLAWNASAPVAGGENSQITIDWGVNAAILFGRQKSAGESQKTANEYRYKYYAPTSPPFYGVTNIYRVAVPHNRSRSVTIPNVGGFAGLSFRYQSAKLSFGYRADLFLGAVDTGHDARHTVDRNFYGPFATISMGL